MVPRHGPFGRVWPDPPAWWWHSEEEWVVYWFLKHKLKLVEGQDFYYQGRVYLENYTPNKNFTQADFIIDLGPETPVGQIGDLNALVLDPFTEFTHNKKNDFDRWAALLKEGYAVIYMASDDVKYRTAHVVAEALKGKDISNRGWGTG